MCRMGDEDEEKDLLISFISGQLISENYFGRSRFQGTLCCSKKELSNSKSCPRIKWVFSEESELPVAGCVQAASGREAPGCLCPLRSSQGTTPDSDMLHMFVQLVNW